LSAGTPDLARTICDEIATAVASVRALDRTAAIDALTSARRVFVAGEGRSGLVLRMAAMRLVHLGMTVHVVGDATTPAIDPGDLLIAGSGSGETPVTLLVAEQARRAGASILAVTATETSRLAALADTRLILRTPAKGNQDTGASIQPGGSLFEQSMLVLFDTLFLQIAGDTAAAQIEQRHANME
jgi:6-phospho-3-hexuloisomerase